eukprot:jgi/Mesvir1/19782/Mv13079-RA.2
MEEQELVSNNPPGPDAIPDDQGAAGEPGLSPGEDEDNGGAQLAEPAGNAAEDSPAEGGHVTADEPGSAPDSADERAAAASPVSLAEADSNAQPSEPQTSEANEGPASHTAESTTVEADASDTRLAESLGEVPRALGAPETPGDDSAATSTAESSAAAEQIKPPSTIGFDTAESVAVTSSMSDVPTDSVEFLDGAPSVIPDALSSEPVEGLIGGPSAALDASPNEAVEGQDGGPSAALAASDEPSSTPPDEPAAATSSTDIAPATTAGGAPPGSPPVVTTKLGLLEDGTYDPAAFTRVPGESELPPTTVSIHHSFGLEVSRRNNVHYIAPEVLLHVSGCQLHILDLIGMSSTYIASLDGGGIGAVAVHPSRKYFAVCEKGASPNVYIYSYPGLKILKILRDGTERAYSAAVFNTSGDALATVGSYPDYWLTLWRWEEEAIILRSKAFSQEVFRVSFSEFFPGQLTSSGTGHIRFWKMATTFTGLKLQGQLGKYGSVELSDISAYAELPDGKVVSGTESGVLLIWDGGLIKTQVTRTGGVPCHVGLIEEVVLDRTEQAIVTAGVDGYVHHWDLDAIDAADTTDDLPRFEMEPLHSVCLGPGVRIKQLLRLQDHWIVQDEAGALLRVNLPSFETQVLLECHAGSINAVAASPLNHFAASCSSDGSVRLTAYRERKTLFNRRFPCGAPGGATCLLWLPRMFDPFARTVAAGFADGVLRVMLRCMDQWKLVHVVKPHKAAITCISMSPDSMILASGSQDRTIFFLDTKKSFGPIGFVKLPSEATCMEWSRNSQWLLVGCAGGDILRLSRPSSSANVTSTFHILVEMQMYNFVLPKLPKKAKKAKSAATQEAEAEAATAAHKKAGEGGAGGPAAPGQDGQAAGAAPAGDASDASTAKDGEGNAAAADGAASGKDGGAETKEEKDAAAKAAEEAAAAEEAELAKGPFRIRRVMHKGTDENSFYVTIEGLGAGYVFECNWMENQVARFWEAHPGSPVGVLCESYSRDLLLTGADDGTVRAAPWDGQHDASAKFWFGHVHDSVHGATRGLAVSFDDSFLLSVGADGSFFAFKCGIHSTSPQDGEAIAVPSVLLEARLEVEDITDPGAYSLEESKQKVEADNAMDAAERKKASTRELLQFIRSDFEALLKENEALPEAERLPRSEFEIDPDLRSMIERETAEKCEIARKELAWESEKKALALAKMRRWFLDNVEVERCVMRAFRAPKKVTTFRTARLSPEMQRDIAAVYAALQEEEAARRIKDGQGGAGGGGDGDGDGEDGPGGGIGAHGQRSGNGDDADTGSEKPLTKQDLRRMQRKKREAEWEAFNKTRPDKNYEDPADAAAIEEAKNNMGDFKLKTDPDYIVPEAQQVNAEKKRRQMLLLQEAVHGIRMEFNARFMALRDVKHKIVRDITRWNTRLAEINLALGVREALFVPEILLDEVPEKREEVTPSELLAFYRKKRSEEKDAKAKGSAGGFGGFGGSSAAAKKTAAADEAGDALEKFLEELVAKSGGQGPAAIAPSPADAPPVPAPATGPAPAPTAGAAGARPGEAADPKKPAAAAGKDAKAGDARSKAASPAPAKEEAPLAAPSSGVQMSQLELSEQMVLHRHLQYEKKTLLARVDEAVAVFDDTLEELRREKFRLEADLKMAELKMLVFYRELALLKEFEKSDVSLKQRSTSKAAEKAEMLAKIADCQEKLAQKKDDVDKLLERKKSIQAQFDAAVEETHPCREALLKIFNRRIKRSKKPVDGEEDDYDSDAEEEEEDGESDDDYSDVEEEVCPPGCEQALYDKVCDLREKKLDQEDAIKEFQAQMDVFKKDKDSFLKKQRTIEAAIKVIEEETQEFQKVKQNKLNEIDVVLTLKMHQMEYLDEDGSLPKDLSQGVVFSNAVLGRLKERVRELIAEKASLRKQQVGLRKEHVALVKDRKAKEQRIAELEARAYDVQMLKFGQVINLDVLDRMGSNKGVEELKEALAKQEAEHAKEHREWQKRVEAATKELAGEHARHAYGGSN